MRRLHTVVLAGLMITLGWAAAGAQATGEDPSGWVQVAVGDAVQVAVGDGHVCVLHEDGNVYCHGGGNFSGERIDYTKGDAVQVAASDDQTCILTSQGNVECWGRLSEGYQGGDAVQIDTSTRHACAVLQSGDVHCWGANWAGQSEDHFGEFSQVTVGSSETCALEPANGRIECWGSDLDGSHFDDSTVQISAGRDHLCKLSDDGAVRCWGKDTHGETDTYVPGPFPAIQVSTGTDQTCVILEGGTTDCWGRDWGPTGEEERWADAVQLDVGSGTACYVTSTKHAFCYLRLRAFPSRAEGSLENGQTSQDVPGQEVHEGPKDVTTPPIVLPETCQVEPCEEGTPVSTPGLSVPRTCAVLFCVGPFDVPSIGLGTLGPICQTAPEACLEERTLVPSQTASTPEVGPYSSPTVQLTASVTAVSGLDPPDYPPGEVGPIEETVTLPLLGDVPVTLCPTGCPVPDHWGADVELGLVVTITVDDTTIQRDVGISEAVGLNH